MSYEHVTTLEQFRALTPEQQKEAVQEKQANVRQRVEQTFDDVVARQQLEQALVPRLPIKPAARPEPQPERQIVGPPISGDPDSVVREFFKQNPDARQVLLGNILYERGRR